MATPHLDVVNRVSNDLLGRRSLEQLVEEALDFAHCNGLALRSADFKDRSDVCQVAPMALFPSPFPKKLFDQANDVQAAMMELYFRLAWEHDFLIESHKEVIKTDLFTRKMVDIYEHIWAEGVPQSKSLVTQRADYMCNVAVNPEGELKQIEVNNIAVSMGGLAQRVSLWHRKIECELGTEKVGEKVPKNRPVDVLSEGLYHAWLSYGDSTAAILVVVEEVNQNQLDQRFIEHHVSELGAFSIPIVRATLTQCASRLSLDESKDLVLDEKLRVGLVYFRSGYSPANYPTDTEWTARLTMERSNAIKCPWIGLQLANTKKVQQVLAQPGVVERFFPDNLAAAQAVRATFAGLWGLEHTDEETKRVVADAIAHPHRYVLKPQLEGGGGNFYGEEIPVKLQTMSADELSAHILMERIQPLVVKNVLVRAFQPPMVSNVVSELGIYGYLFGDAQQSKRVDAHGHILRSKAEHVNEGGVAVGAAVIDSPYLF